MHCFFWNLFITRFYDYLMNLLYIIFTVTSLFILSRGIFENLLDHIKKKKFWKNIKTSCIIKSIELQWKQKRKILIRLKRYLQNYKIKSIKYFLELQIVFIKLLYIIRYFLQYDYCIELKWIFENLFDLFETHFQKKKIINWYVIFKTIKASQLNYFVKYKWYVINFLYVI